MSNVINIITKRLLLGIIIGHVISQSLTIRLHPQFKFRYSMTVQTLSANFNLPKSMNATSKLVKPALVLQYNEISSFTSFILFLLF